MHISISTAHVSIKYTMVNFSIFMKKISKNSWKWKFWPWYHMQKWFTEFGKKIFTNKIFLLTICPLIGDESSNGIFSVTYTCNHLGVIKLVLKMWNLLGIGHPLPWWPLNSYSQIFKTIEKGTSIKLSVYNCHSSSFIEN